MSNLQTFGVKASASARAKCALTANTSVSKSNQECSAIFLKHTTVFLGCTTYFGLSPIKPPVMSHFLTTVVFSRSQPIGLIDISATLIPLHRKLDLTSFFLESFLAAFSLSTYFLMDRQSTLPSIPSHQPLDNLFIVGVLLLLWQ